MKNNRKFKDDIETAERMILIGSWVTIIVTTALFAVAIWGIS